MSTEPKTVQLILVRHGQTDWNVEGRFQGHKGLGLNAVGFDQIKHTASKVSMLSPQHLFASDLLRAIQTAEPISHVCNIPIQQDSRLREIHLGDWEGEISKEIKLRYPDFVRDREENPTTSSAPNGESLLDVQARVVSALRDILSDRQGPVTIVSHAITLAVLRATLGEFPLRDGYSNHMRNGEVHLATLTESSLKDL